MTPYYALADSPSPRAEIANMLARLQRTSNSRNLGLVSYPLHSVCYRAASSPKWSPTRAGVGVQNEKWEVRVS